METSQPWYRRVRRWGQTNLTERDPVRYDSGWWREHWRRTRIQGVIVNAGGIVAYYPSKHPLHYRARFLGDRDLYGEIVAAAREEGLAVLARMGSDRADKRFYVEHPTGSRTTPLASPTGRASTTSPASTAPTTASICRRSCARSSSAATPTASPTIESRRNSVAAAPPPTPAGAVRQRAGG